MRKFLRSHSLLSFFGLTFVLSWAIWVPMALDHYALLPVRLDPNFVLVVRLFGTFGPAAAAMLVSLALGGRPALKALLRQLGMWRVGYGWYLAAGVVFPALVFVTAGLYRLLPGATPLPVQPVSASGLAVVMIIMTLSVLGEEIGWRGFALPRLQRRWTALQSSLILGTIWTLWHLPFWIVLGELERYGAGYWLLGWAFILAGTTYVTWIMNNTGNSVAMAVLFHWSFNIVTSAFLPITTVVPAYGIFVALAWATALLVVALYGARRLARPAGLAQA